MSNTGEPFPTRTLLQTTTNRKPIYISARCSLHTQTTQAKSKLELKAYVAETCSNLLHPHAARRRIQKGGPD